MEKWRCRRRYPDLTATQVSGPCRLLPVGICPGWICPAGLLADVPCHHSCPNLSLSLPRRCACAVASGHCGPGVSLVSVPCLACGSARAVARVSPKRAHTFLKEEGECDGAHRCCFWHCAHAAGVFRALFIITSIY